MNQAESRISKTGENRFFMLARCLFLAGLIINVIVFCSTTIKASGTLDPGFGTGGKVITNINSDYAEGVLIQPDGKIILVGSVGGNPSTGYDFALLRYNTDGTLDSSFGSGGTFLVDVLGRGNTAEAAVLQPDGKIVVVGHVHIPASAEADFAVARVNSNGTLDTSFGTNGTVTIGFGINDLATDVGLQSNGKIVVVGYTGLGNSADIMMVRYNSNGSLDTSFGTNGLTVIDVGGGTDDYANAVAILPDDKILIGGNSSGAALLRYDSSGHLDSSFGTSGVSKTNFGLYETISALVVQPDGKILTAGSMLSGTTNFGLLRFLSNGNIDTSFGTAGKTETDFYDNTDTGNAIALRADGKIVVAGNVAYNGGGGNYPSHFGTCLYNSDGTLAGKAVTQFSGYWGYGRAVAIQADGKIVIAGTLQPINPGINDFGLARYNSISIDRTPFDFDGDGKTDISVYRPSLASRWFVLRSSWFYPQPIQYDDVQFGASGDLIVPGDYDGDFKSDYAVFRPSTGTWYTSLNPATNYGAFHWGQNGDVPVPGDYDGDGKTDRAIYRPSTGTWWVARSSDGGYIQQLFGTSTDRPVIGDFDGDTKTDFAYISRTGGLLVWHILQSSNSVTVTQQFGLDTDTAVAADYDGDGKTNIAVFRSSTGNWYTSLNPATNYGEKHFGQNGDIPVPGDYDGDGKADIGVYRPPNGDWYAIRSIDGYLITQRWGVGTDQPLQSAYTPQ